MNLWWGNKDECQEPLVWVRNHFPCVTLGTPMWTCALIGKGNVEIQIWQIGSISNLLQWGRERACGCEREKERQRGKGKREGERETYLNAFTLKQNYITFKGFNQEPILCKPDWVHIQIIIESVSVVYNLSAMTSERNIWRRGLCMVSFYLYIFVCKKDKYSQVLCHEKL